MLTLSLFTGTHSMAQNIASKPKKIITNVTFEKHLSSSILLWMRTDKPRQDGMNRWQGAHAKIISANKGLWEYRQIHLEENNTGLWPSIKGVETTIRQVRKIDGVADVTLKNFFSLLRGKKQNKLASNDEVNLFKRTILYAAFPKNSKWYNVANYNAKIEARSLVFFRIKQGVTQDDFNKFILEELTPMLANTEVLQELRSKTYNKWQQSQWNTPNVAHDNANEVQFQASFFLGFKNKPAMEEFFKSESVQSFSSRISIFCSAVHAYTIRETLTFVMEGKELENFQK